MTSKPVPQEQDRVRSGVIWAVSVTSVIVTIAAIATAYGFASQRPHEAARPLGEPPREIGSGTPVDTTSIEADDFGVRLRNEQEKKLQSYGWVDKGKGVGRIPIDKAMDIIANGGQP